LRDSFAVRQIRIRDSRITRHLSKRILIRFLDRRGGGPFV
jgi:hypothetical protein